MPEFDPELFEPAIERLRRAEQPFNELRATILAQLAEKKTIDAATLDRINSQVLPQFEGALSQARQDERGHDGSNETTWLSEYVALRLMSWQRLASACESNDAEMLTRH